MKGRCSRPSCPLPAVERPKPQGRAAAPADVGGLRLLVAEDNATNRLVIATLLGQLGIEVHIAENGADAVEAWRVGAWDLVLMDIQMPVMDGLEAVRRIRALESQDARARTPVLALTANDMSHHLAEYAKTGFDGVAAKPVQLDALLAAMDAAIATIAHDCLATAAPPVRAASVG